MPRGERLTVEQILSLAVFAPKGEEEGELGLATRALEDTRPLQLRNASVKCISAVHNVVLRLVTAKSIHLAQNAT